jgi:predicted nucleotidyltransferase
LVFHYPADVREILIDAIRETLQGQSDVLFAYVHGSILTALPFCDVDIAIYWGIQNLQEMRSRHFLTLAALDKAVSSVAHTQTAPPVDLLALNRAPLGFRYQVLQRGRLLVSHDDALRVRWTVETLTRYLDLKPLRDRALKEAMTA